MYVRLHSRNKTNKMRIIEQLFYTFEVHNSDEDFHVQKEQEEVERAFFHPAPFSVF